MVCCRACLPGAWCHRECWLPGLRAPSKWWPQPQTLHMPCTLRPPPQPGTSNRHVHGSCDRRTRAWLTCGVGVVPQEFFDCSNLDMGDLVRLQQWWPRGFSHTLYAHSMVSHVGLGHVCNSRGSGVAAVASLQVPTPGFHGPPHTSARAPSAVRSHGKSHGLLPLPQLPQLWCTHGVVHRYPQFRATEPEPVGSTAFPAGRLQQPGPTADGTDAVDETITPVQEVWWRLGLCRCHCCCAPYTCCAFGRCCGCCPATELAARGAAGGCKFFVVCATCRHLHCRRQRH